MELRQELLGKGGMDPHFREPNLTLLQDTKVGSDCPKMAAHSEFQSVDMFNKNSNQVFLITFFCRIHCNLHVAFVVTTHWQLWQEDLKAAITKVSHGEAPVKRASPVVGVPRGSKSTTCGFGDVHYDAFI